MANYFKNTYDPSLQDFKTIFPDFEHTTKEKWIEEFQNGYHMSSSQMAEYAYNKLDAVTTSYRLSDDQRSRLQGLINGEFINRNIGWKTYWDILTPRQLDYVGY